MSRRTLDVIFAVGGLVVVLLVLVLGLVLQNQADFAKDYEQPARTTEDRLHTGEGAEAE